MDHRVRKRVNGGGGWHPLSAPTGELIISFGEMMEVCSESLVKATPRRIIGTSHERLSVLLFFNPSVGTNIAPMGSCKTMSAGDHLASRCNETYVDLKE